MPSSSLSPHLTGFKIEEVQPGDEAVLAACLRGQESTCPVCGKPSTRVHPRYGRILTDAPAAGRPVRIWLTVRRFFCDNPDCWSKTFVEQVDGLTPRWSRVSEGASADTNGDRARAG
jgi:transposase